MIQLAAIHLAAKGRVQDTEYNKDPEVAKLVAMGRDAIPFLIGRLEDETPVPLGALDYWPSARVGELALLLLTDLFLDADWKRSTVQGTSFEDFAPGAADLPAWDRLRSFVKGTGRQTIKETWTRIWLANQAALQWDTKARCFRLQNRADAGAPTR